VNRRRDGRPGIVPGPRPDCAACDNVCYTSGSPGRLVNDPVSGSSDGFIPDCDTNRREQGLNRIVREATKTPYLDTAPVGSDKIARLGGATRPHGTPGNGNGWHELTERFPGELEQGLTRLQVCCTEVGDISEEDPDRIATPDVARFLSPMGMGEFEEDGISGCERFSGGQWEDRIAASTSLHVRDPLFIGRITVHLSILIRDINRSSSGSLPPWQASLHARAGGHRRGRATTDLVRLGGGLRADWIRTVEG